MKTVRAGQGGRIEVTITSLEMLARPARDPAPMPAAVSIERAIKPSVAFYRFLYNTVGEDWLWADRRREPDLEIAANGPASRR